jgi:hypothetical protein
MRQVNFKPHSRLKNPRTILELSVQVIINSGGGGDEEEEEEEEQEEEQEEQEEEEEQEEVEEEEQGQRTHGVGWGLLSKPKVKNTARCEGPNSALLNKTAMRFQE